MLTPLIMNTFGRLRAAADRFAFLGPILARPTVGLVFIGTGWGKLHSLGDVTDFFASLHIPAPGFNARLAASLSSSAGSWCWSVWGRASCRSRWPSRWWSPS